MTLSVAEGRMVFVIEPDQLRSRAAVVFEQLRDEAALQEPESSPPLAAEEQVEVAANSELGALDVIPKPPPPRD